jgi:hypothetical protein
MSIRQHWHTPFARATSGEMTCYNATHYVAARVLCFMLATAARVYAEECLSFAVFGIVGARCEKCVRTHAHVTMLEWERKFSKNADRFLVTGVCSRAPTKRGEDTGRHLTLFVICLLDHPDVGIGAQAHFADDWEVDTTLQAFRSSSQLGLPGHAGHG